MRHTDYSRQLQQEYERSSARQARLRERKWQRAFFVLLMVTMALGVYAFLKP